VGAAEHPALMRLDLRHNVIRNDGAKGISRIIRENEQIDHLDLSFNMYAHYPFLLLCVMYIHFHTRFVAFFIFLV